MGGDLIRRGAAGRRLQPPQAPPITRRCCQPQVPVSAFPPPRRSRSPPTSHTVHAQSLPQIRDSRSRPCLSFHVSRIIIYKNSHKVKRPPLPIAGMTPPHAHSGETPLWSPASQLTPSPPNRGVPGKVRARTAAAMTPTGQQRAPSAPLTDGPELSARCVCGSHGWGAATPREEDVHSPGHPGSPETETAPPHPAERSASAETRAGGRDFYIK